MFPIKPRRRRQRNEELTAVGILPAISHTHDPGTGMFQRRVDLVRELVAVYARPPASRARGVACLHHEVRDDPVEDDVVVIAARSEGREVRTCLGRVGRVQFDGDGALQVGWLS